MKNNSKVFTFPDLIKILISFMLVYEGWYLENYSAISGALQILALLIIASTAVLIVGDKNSRKSSEVIVWWVFFGIYSIVAALCIGANIGTVLDSLFTYFAFVAVIYCAGVVSNYTADHEWFSKTILLICIISAYSALINGVEYQNGEYFVRTMSEFNNPNNLGLMMGIGTFFALYQGQNIRLFGWVVRVVLAVSFFIVTINTGSRSALLCDIAVIVVFFYARFKGTTGSVQHKFMKKVFLIVTVIALAMFAVRIITSRSVENSAIRRLIEKFSYEEFSGRTDLYDRAWELFLGSPFVGVGYNCFAEMSGYGYFTHSTYMELLACSGIIGFILFLTPVFRRIRASFENFRYDKGRGATIITMMLVSGFFGIVYYNMVFLMVLYMEIIRIQSVRKVS